MSRLERLYSPPEIGAPGKSSARRRRRDLTLAGLFVLTMAAVVLGTLALLVPGLLGGAYRLHAYFSDASGLYRGTQVIQGGFVIGVVESMEPVFPDRNPKEASRCPEAPAGPGQRSPRLPCFRASLRIRANWPVPKNSTVQLGSAGLLQGEAIKIRPGDSSHLLADGEIISSQGRETDLMDQLESLTKSVRGLVDKTIEPALRNISDQIQTIKDLLGTEDDSSGNRDRLAGVFGNLQRLSANLEKALNPEQLVAIMAAVQQLSEDLAQVSGTLGGRTDDIQQTVKSYGDLATDIRGLIKKSKPPLERSLDDTQYLLQELAAALTPILINIQDATRNLSVLSRDLRSNPAVIIRGRKEKNETPWFE